MAIEKMVRGVDLALQLDISKYRKSVHRCLAIFCGIEIAL